MITFFALFFPYAILNSHTTWWYVAGMSWAGWISIFISIALFIAAMTLMIYICGYKIVSRAKIHNKKIKLKEYHKNRKKGADDS